jgi:hypothetical protein
LKGRPPDNFFRVGQQIIEFVVAIIRKGAAGGQVRSIHADNRAIRSALGAAREDLICNPIREVNLVL